MKVLSVRIFKKVEKANQNIRLGDIWIFIGEESSLCSNYDYSCSKLKYVNVLFHYS